MHKALGLILSNTYNSKTEEVAQLLKAGLTNKQI